MHEFWLNSTAERRVSRAQTRERGPPSALAKILGIFPLLVVTAVVKIPEGVVVGFQTKISAIVDGGPAEGLACADPGARTPIGASGICFLYVFAGNANLAFYIFLFLSLIEWCCMCLV